MQRITDYEHEYKQQFARRFRKLVHDSGMTVYEIADKLELHNVSVYGYMRGNALPKAHSIARICTVFNIDANELLDVKKVNTCKLK